MSDKTYWRDLELGEVILIGDRCFGADESWFEIKESNLIFATTVEEPTRPIQRKSESIQALERQVKELKKDKKKLRDRFKDIKTLPDDYPMMAIRQRADNALK